MAGRSEIGRRRDGPPATRASSAAELAAFLDAARAAAPPAGRGRLVFALDATMSRQPTWDAACALQGEMFRAAGRVGGLAVQLVYFRGLDEARASPWLADAAALGRAMAGVACRGGLTQLGRVLDHAAKEAARRPVAALAFVGDAAEENVDALADKAGRLALRGVRAFMFLEGRDPAAERAFREIARITGGVLLPFDRSAAGELAALLGAVAAYAAGGRPALAAAGTGAARRLLADLRP
jgi:hypothetical protein